MKVAFPSKSWLRAFLALIGAFFSLVQSAQAQWVTEEYELKAGWNAIWLGLDASHDSIENLTSGHVQDLGSGGQEVIEEVWRWNPIASTATFTESPDTPPDQGVNPVQPDTRWFVFERGFPDKTTITTFSPNGAYLVKVADGATDLTLQITGRPVSPTMSWNSSGLNFFGFPLQESASTQTHNFERFLALTPRLSASADIFRYVGGDLGDANPVQVTAPRLVAMKRGEAYWIKSTQFSDYYGPLQVNVSRMGLDYGDTQAALTFQVKNTTNEPLYITLTPVSSATPPAGQAPVAGNVPMKLRGDFDPSTGQFPFTALGASASVTLEANAHKEFVVAVDRTAMAGNPGDVFQSILQLTESLGVARIDLPVRAITTSPAGLWVGSALVDQVDQITAAPEALGNGLASVQVTTHSDAAAPASFPLRLILHRSESGAIKLLQQVYQGRNQEGELIITPSESLLDSSRLKDARRVSTASLPLDENLTGTGADLGLSGTMTFSSTLSHTAATNPFVHTYHPDHDNKDAQLNPTPLPEGVESYAFTREISLEFAETSDAVGVTELGWGSTVLGGHYQEQVTGLRAQPITVKGSFILRRVSTIATLTE